MAFLILDLGMARQLTGNKIHVTMLAKFHSLCTGTDTPHNGKEIIYRSAYRFD